LLFPKGLLIAQAYKGVKAREKLQDEAGKLRTAVSPWPLEERLLILLMGNAVHFNPVLKEQQE